MRAVVARNRRLVVDDVADPVPRPGDALVAVRACGICGSDLHTLEHAEHLVDVAAALDSGLTFDPEADYVLGHEWCGEVVELGPDTDATVAPGDLVVSVPYLVRGDSLLPLGFVNDAPGGFSERMLLTAALCLRVPNGLDHRRAALTEPMAVALHAVNRSTLATGDAAVVIGCGPIGLAIIAWLRVLGVEPIVASDVAARRRALAEALGAHTVVDPLVEPVVDAWRRLGGLEPLVIYEAVGVPGMLDRAIFDAPPAARIVVAGVCMQPDTIRPLIAIVKELDLRFVYAYTEQEFAVTLQAISEGKVDVTPLVSGVVGLDGVATAFEVLRQADEHVKVLVEPGGPSTVEAVSL